MISGNVIPFPGVYRGTHDSSELAASETQVIDFDTVRNQTALRGLFYSVLDLVHVQLYSHVEAANLLAQRRTARKRGAVCVALVRRRPSKELPGVVDVDTVRLEEMPDGDVVGLISTATHIPHKTESGRKVNLKVAPTPEEPLDTDTALQLDQQITVLEERQRELARKVRTVRPGPLIPSSVRQRPTLKLV